MNRFKISGIKNAPSGFTIVELLIVIVVIAILATISIVAYSGIQRRATNATVQSDLSSFQKKMELVKIDATDGTYPGTLTQSMGFKFSKSAYMVNRYNLYYCPSADRMQYAFGVVSKDNVHTMYSSASNAYTNTTVDGNTTCAVVGLGNVGQQGHTYASGVGTWQPWVN